MLFRSRECSPNPKRKMDKKIKLLWRTGLAHIQAANMLPAYKEKSKDFVRKRIVESVSEELLQKQVSEELFERDYTTIEETIQEFRESRKYNPAAQSKNKIREENAGCR